MRKTQYKHYKNTVNTSTRITKTPTHYKTQTHTYPHITKQAKTKTVQVKITTVQDYSNEIFTVQSITLSIWSP